MKNETKHTPTPWKVHSDVNNQIAADGDEEFLIGELDTGNIEDDNANAAYIVQCVNAHEVLLAELHRVAEDMNTLVDNDEHWNRSQMREVIFAIQSNATNAIAKAEGK